MHTRNGKCDNQSVIRPRVDTTIRTCMGVHRGSGNNIYDIILDLFIIYSYTVYHWKIRGNPDVIVSQLQKTTTTKQKSPEIVSYQALPSGWYLE